LKDHLHGSTLTHGKNVFLPIESPTLITKDSARIKSVTLNKKNSTFAAKASCNTNLEFGHFNCSNNTIDIKMTNCWGLGGQYDWFLYRQATNTYTYIGTNYEDDHSVTIANFNFSDLNGQIRLECHITFYDPTLGAYQQVKQFSNYVSKSVFTAKPIIYTGAKPFMQYWDGNRQDHLYTADWCEIGVQDKGYLYERVIGHIYTTQVAGSVPLHRYFNSRTEDHFYTTNYNELGSGNAGYAYEAIAGYVFKSQSSNQNLIPVYRYNHAGKGDHFYTSDYTELGNGKDGYAIENEIFYILKN
jgi:hypothetical protein